MTAAQARHQQLMGQLADLEATLVVETSVADRMSDAWLPVEAALQAAKTRLRQALFAMEEPPQIYRAAAQVMSRKGNAALTVYQVGYLLDEVA